MVLQVLLWRCCCYATGMTLVRCWYGFLYGIVIVVVCHGIVWYWFGIVLAWYQYSISMVLV